MNIGLFLVTGFLNVAPRVTLPPLNSSEGATIPIIGWFTRAGAHLVEA